ncbi:hypothetical protein AHAS_Ahas19G0092200 [Arachis hypogaea]
MNAVAQLVGQFVKLTGCYVVGSAESKDKYNCDQPEHVANLITKRIHMQGSAVPDYYPRYANFLEYVVRKIKEEKIVYVEDIAEGLENGLAALFGLFNGRNVGKQVLVLARE